MGAHLIDGEFQSDKYPTTPRGKVPLSVKDKTAQDLLWEYAQRRREVDAEFSDDLEIALHNAGYVPSNPLDRLIGWYPVEKVDVYGCCECTHRNEARFVRVTKSNDGTAKKADYFCAAHHDKHMMLEALDGR